nr:hypothetical protein [Chloroflexota bacterium]
IQRSDTVRGFEYSKGKYVVIDEGDFDSVPLKTVRAIEIELFVEADRDAHGANFVRQAYYIEPEPVGRKAFYLLKSVLADEGLSAICKIVLKDREALASLNPYSKTMLLTTLYWPDEVRSVEDLDLPDEEFEFKPAEKKMAQLLVSAMKGEFEADSYKDEYREALMAVLEAKVSGQPAEQRATTSDEPTKITDLMKVLEASVAAARQSRTAAADPGPEKAAGRQKKPTPLAAGRKASRTKEAVPGSATATAKSEPKRQERRRKTA